MPRHLPQALLSLFFALLLSPLGILPADESDAAMKDAVLRDWQAQEEHFGRDIASAEALSQLCQRAESLLEYLEEDEAVTPERAERVRAAVERCDIDNLGGLSDDQRRELYIALRTELRAAALENPLVSQRPILFHKGNRFVIQMLHEYMSYYYQMSNRFGGGLYILKNPGKSFQIESVTDGLFPKRGIFMTPSLSYDAKTVYFAYADLTGLPDYYGNTDDSGPELATHDLQHIPDGRDMPAFYRQYKADPKGKLHLYKMDLAAREPIQLTEGNDDDFDPIEIPGGDIIFMSTRRGGYGRCHGTWEPLPVHTLHRLGQDGAITTLSWHETNEWHPAVLHDGRIVYTRWDYIDRSASHHHGLWITNPDGTGAMSLFANYTWVINACYQAKPVPDSNKVVFVAGAHHLDVGGSLVLLDPNKVRYNPEISEDEFDSIERLTPNVPFPETPGSPVPQDYYHSPWPLSEEIYLTAYSHGPNGGMHSSIAPETTGSCGIYYYDKFGNLELLYEDEAFSCQHPMPIAAREVPPVVPSQLPAPGKGGTEDCTGTFFLSNVYESLTDLPADRPIKELRVFELFPKMMSHLSGLPAPGFAKSENFRSYLGSVPVEKDGSAFFRAPAQKPLYFQAVDASGRAVQSMRSDVYLQPGENRGCVGCHEQAHTTSLNEPGFSEAFRHGPSELKPGPAGTAPFYFPTLIQPILDRHCVECHSTNAEASRRAEPILTGESAGNFTRSYDALRPYVRWYGWGSETYRETSTLPGQCGSDICSLSEIIDDEHHQGVKLTDAERRTLYLWMDANVPFTGAER
ncbi:MAG: hypothetical protein IJH68_08705 [Thermoguttaceae bacterium]|nr:hypothetical protein [Thermoguttaceae bacterium]